MDNLKNKVIILTGASKGIGRVTALNLSKYNPRLVLVSRKYDDILKVQNELNKYKNSLLLIEADVSKEEDCKKIVDETVKKFGTIDILINNAAQFARGKVIDLSLEDFDRVWATNVRGVFMLTKFVLPYMIKQNIGTILNIASTAGKRGYVGGSAYTASKFALNGFSECLLKEVREYNIRILTISPSMVDTRLKEESEMEEGGKG
ncbi:MAG: SDR family oxidoreductase, partial [Ignavibacteria bacterium]